MADGARRLEAIPFGLAIVDPFTGVIECHNAAMARLLGRPVPGTVADLDALEVVSPSDRQRFAGISRSLGPDDHCTTIDTRVRHRDGQEVALTVRVAHLHALRGDGSVLAVTATDFDNTFDPVDLELALNPPDEIHVVYDLDLVAIAADQRHVEYGIDPAAQIGTQAFLLGHPEDVVAVNPKVRAVVAREALEARYPLRVIGPAAAWAGVTVTMSRFSGHRDLLLVTNTPLDISRMPLDDCLDDRERAVAKALLVGRRPTQIAEDLAISLHTVRHRMTTLFRKLGVDGQVELRRRYQDRSDPPASASSDAWLRRVVCDADGVVVAVDQRTLDADGTAAGLLGSHATVATHPDDVPLVAPIIRAVAAGDVLEAEYVVRHLDPSGQWSNVTVHACHLAGPNPLLLVTTTPQDRELRTIPPDLLTTGELEVARALFAGRRPAQIADLRGVSIRTVRNQVNTVYRKLDVVNLGELTSRYSLPLRPAPPRARSARSPRDRL